jgi:hypothetical protein
LAIAAVMKRVKAETYKSIGVAVAFCYFFAEEKVIGIPRP